MLPAWVLGLAFGVALIAGLLIGSVGVGGIIIVPILITAAPRHVDVQTAIASCMASYMAAGAVGAATYARRASIEWATTWHVLAGAAPTAFAGSFALKFLSDDAVKATVYALMLATSLLTAVRTVRARRRPPRHIAFSDLSKAAAAAPAPEAAVALGAGPRDAAGRIALGAVAGFGSSVTGTSGPLVSLPLLLLLRWPVTTALGCAQAVQVPIAVASTAAYVALRPRVISWPLAACLGAGLAPAVAAGAAGAHRVPADALKVAVACVLVAAAALALARLAAARVASLA